MNDGRWRRAERVAEVVHDPGTGPVVYAAPLPDGPVLVLEETAGVIWECIGAGGTTDEVVAAVALATGARTDEIDAPVADFLAELARVGLVTAPAGRAPG